MIQLALLLLGVEAVRRHWLTLAVIGAIWAAVGLGIIIDPLDGVQDITMQTLGVLLVIEGAITLVAGVLGSASGRLWPLKSLALIVPGVLIAKTPFQNVVLICVLFGLALLADGLVRLTSTLIVRFPGWRVALAGCGIELVMATLALSPWPLAYGATVPFCVGTAFVLSGWAVIRSALLLRRLPPGAPVSSLPIFEHRRGWQSYLLLPGPFSSRRERDCGEEKRLIVHVWTPLASAADPVRRPLLDRYIAAIDRRGTISTGHAALECPPDLYISHYRASEQDRSRDEFREALHAGEKNDVEGRFLPSYREEAGEWCASTVQVVFHRFNEARLGAFWAAYRQNSTYNLTNRNCSVAVALALDAALEGVLGEAEVWPPFLQLIVHPGLYLATLLRKRARTMTWTPGLVLDYARALRNVVEPAASSSWVQMLLVTVDGFLRARARQRGRAPARPLSGGVSARR